MNGVALVEKVLHSLEDKYGVSIVVKDMYSFMQTNAALCDLLRNFFAHKNSYCMFVKGYRDTLGECTVFEHTEMGRQMNLNTKQFECGSIVTCPFGVKELYYPIRCQGKTIAAILVGCTHCSKQEFSEICLETESKYKINRELMQEKYDMYIAGQQFPQDDEFYQSLALCGELLSMICDKLLSNVSIEKFFNYDFILNNNNNLLDLNEILQGKRLVSRNKYGENVNMTIILNAITYIKNNFSQKITISKIAEYCFCSTSTLSHIFAKNYGMTIGNLIHTVRCDHAKELLKNSDLSISQIAFECGFSNADYFTNVFKKTVGITPTEYRQKNV